MNAMSEQIAEYMLETEHGMIHVSAAEFQDVADRYAGAYGSDFKFDPFGNERRFTWEDEGTLRVGRTYVNKSAPAKLSLSPFEIQLQKLARSGDTAGVLKMVQSLI